MSDVALAPLRTGYFGKLPQRGDFVQKGLSAPMVAALDGWLQAAIVSSRQALGTAWEAAYLAAPIWHFQLPAGVFGPHACVGAMMPSVDKVGRLFPLVIVATHGSAVNLTRLWHAGVGWIDAVETILLNALGEIGRFEDFEVAVEGLSRMALTPDAPLTEDGTTAAALSAFLDAACGTDAALWLSLGTGEDDLVWFATTAPPAASLYTDLLVGTADELAKQYEMGLTP